PGAGLQALGARCKGYSEAAQARIRHTACGEIGNWLIKPGSPFPERSARMRVKTLIAYVVIAGALPLASSWANEPEPQDAALNGSPAVALTSERSSDQSAL